LDILSALDRVQKLVDESKRLMERVAARLNSAQALIERQRRLCIPLSAELLMDQNSTPKQ